MQINKRKNQKGFSVVEIILAAGLFTIFSASAITLFIQSLESNRQDEQRERATTYASEGIEAVRAIRDGSFDDLDDTNGAGLKFSNGKWSFDGAHDNLDIFQRMVTVSPVQRDGQADIIASGGTSDLDMKKVTVEVSWTSSYQKKVSVDFTTYLSRWK